MKLSLNWLKDFVQIPSSFSAQKIGELVTLRTAEVEGVIDESKAYDKMVVGKVLSIEKHPNADKLKVVHVDIGTYENNSAEPIQVVCGGQNLKEGMLVAVALPEAQVKWHGEGDLVTLEDVAIRGEKSHGMICAGEEIGLEADNTTHSTEVHIKNLSHLKASPGTPLAEALDKNDVILEIDNKSLTHRPDLWGHYGFAREMSAILDQRLKPLASFLKETPKKSSTKTSKLKPKITIENPEICTRFSACIVTGIEVKESPNWIKTRLEAVGIRPINTVVDVTNYVMVEIGQPMHAYDRHVLNSNSEHREREGEGAAQAPNLDHLIARYAKPNETLETIDHKTRPLQSTDPVVANAKGVLGVAGIMGGAQSEINSDTTEIILEAACWDPIILRKSSTIHGLRSEASQRFEKSLDPTLTEIALKRACVLLKKIYPHAEIGEITTAGNWSYKPIEIVVDPKSLSNKIGVEISTSEIKKILKSLEFGFGVTSVGKKLSVTVPSHRATKDVDIEEDIIEEVARIYGYERLPEKLPELPIQLPIENEERTHKHATRNILAKTLGFTEINNYSFYNETLFKNCGLEEMTHLKVQNPLSEEQTHMRISLIPGVLKTIVANQRQKNRLKLFEIGRTYREIGEFMPLEEKWLAAAYTDQSKKENFYEIKGALEHFLKEFRPPKFELRETSTPPTYAHPQKTLEIVINGNPIGYVFTLHPETAQRLELEHSVSLFELNFTKLSKAGRKIQPHKPLPKFPSLFFDISILMDHKTTVADIEKTIRSADSKNLITSLHLFDIYSGKNIPEGKKSLAFTVELNHPERTVTDSEFKEIQRATFETIERLGGEIRGLTK